MLNKAEMPELVWCTVYEFVQSFRDIAMLEIYYIGPAHPYAVALGESRSCFLHQIFGKCIGEMFTSIFEALL